MTSTLTESGLSKREFPKLKNDLVLRAAWGEKLDTLPIWMMRQAGRYLPEFQAYRKEHSFFEICRTPEFACEVTLMPIRRFSFDAAIIFSDILVVPQALGMVVEMQAGVGPVLPNPLTVDTLQTLNTDGAVSRLKYVGEAITLTRHKLEGKVPLFGFSGAPWTLMGYMIEGGGSKTLSKAKKWLYAYPEQAHNLLDLLTNVIIDYLVMQIDYGAQIVQVFDSSAEYLNKDLYEIFGLPYLKKIARTVKQKVAELGLPKVPMVVFAKGGHFCIEEVCSLGYEVIGIDWTMDSNIVNNIILPKKLAIQGNLDPCALYAPKDKLRKLVIKMLENFKNHNYIVNLGHGVYPDADLEAVEVFIDTVHKFQLGN